MTELRGHILRALLCISMVFGGVTLSATSAEAHGGPAYKRNHRHKAWRYRPNVWRGQPNGHRWRSTPRYRRIPRRPVYTPPRPRHLMGPGWVWVPAPPPTVYRQPRVYVVPKRAPAVVAPGEARIHPAPPAPLGAPSTERPEGVTPTRSAPDKAPTPDTARTLPPDMDPSLPPHGAVPAPARPQPSVTPPKGPVAPRPPSATGAPLPPTTTTGLLGYARTSAIASEVLRLVNAERAKRRLPALADHVRLSTAGWLHSKEMYTKRYFSHRSPSKGSITFTDRIRNAGVIKHGAAGENIAMTHVSTDVARRLVKMWMSSPGHRANIMHKDFRFSGLGVYGDEDYIYVTQVFTAKVNTPSLNKPVQATPPARKPTVTGPTKLI